MGRSVWTPHDAIETVFFDFEPGSYCETCEVGTVGYTCDECGSDTVSDYDMDSHCWNELVTDIRETITEKYPSFSSCDEWPELESHAILENALCRIEIGEYCGTVALSVVSKDHFGSGYGYDASLHGLAQRFGRHVGKFISATWARLSPIGTASNGETFYKSVV